MSHLRHTFLAVSLAAASMGAWAQADAQQKQHQATVLATERASAAPAASMATPGSAERMAAMDSKMKAMHEMHEKMINAKTPDERKALKVEHMKTMHDGMAMMNMMDGAARGEMQAGKPMPGNMEQRQQMMEKRMEMMESMMQMMMDRIPPL